jgi:two-component system, NarL family, nitrate/nitrite response regulator NarL
MPERTILLVDDHPVFRGGLRALLEGEPWVGLVLEAGTVQQAVETARTATIDLAVMDLRLPDGDGVQATRRVLATQPGIRVVMLSMSDDQRSILEALDAGARGYVIKLSGPEVILAALQTVAYGGLALGPEVDRASLVAGAPPLPPPLDRLTGRELEILTSLASGDTNSVIARKLDASEGLIRTELTTLCTKLEVEDQLHAALLARDHGIGSSLNK